MVTTVCLCLCVRVVVLTPLLSAIHLPAALQLRSADLIGGGGASDRVTHAAFAM